MQGLEDKKVVVIGIGNSGADIAVELSKMSKKVRIPFLGFIIPSVHNENRGTSAVGITVKY